jgi:hypothetical protein
LLFFNCGDAYSFKIDIGFDTEIVLVYYLG